MNPILEIQNNSGVNSAFNTINTINNSGNPNAMLQRLASQNPRVANALNLIQQNGGNPQKAFYAEANRLGINPNQVIGLLNKSLGRTK